MQGSARETLQGMGYFGEPDDCQHDDFEVLDSTQHIARKESLCENNCTIKVGQQYSKTVVIENKRFAIFKHCVGVSSVECKACQEKHDNDRHIDFSTSMKESF